MFLVVLEGNYEQEVRKSTENLHEAGGQGGFGFPPTVFGDNSVSLRRIWTKLGGKSSYKPPGASYTAPGPYIRQGIGKMKERYLYKSFKTF